MSVLTPEMQLKLKEEKASHLLLGPRRVTHKRQISTRIQNELYLRKHPEVKDILHYVMNQVLLTHPEDVIQSAVGLLFLCNRAMESK